MCSEKDEEQVCPTSNCYHYLENKRYVRLLGGKCNDAYTSKCNGVIKHGTDYKMREAKQRGKDLTTGWGTPPFHSSLHTPLSQKSRTESPKDFSRGVILCHSKGILRQMPGYTRRKVELFCQIQVGF